VALPAAARADPSTEASARPWAFLKMAGGGGGGGGGGADSQSAQSAADFLQFLLDVLLLPYGLVPPPPPTTTTTSTSTTAASPSAGFVVNSPSLNKDEKNLKNHNTPHYTELLPLFDNQN